MDSNKQKFVVSTGVKLINYKCRWLEEKKYAKESDFKFKVKCFDRATSTTSLLRLMVEVTRHPVIRLLETSYSHFRKITSNTYTIVCLLLEPRANNKSMKD